ncbi:MAG TPA: alkaline phosphatase family protein [Candidatus Limnocylindrales bacterium]|nr:alkaline phosphatase family protein [Candidatus Limnocylindrales bacterium]
MSTVIRAMARVTLVFCLMANSADAADRVVLVSWDGVRRDVLHELIEWQPFDAAVPEPCPSANRQPERPVRCGQWLTCMPNLCRFQIVDSSDVEGKPLTKPQHAQMLTGYGPRETGDITNAGTVAVPAGMTIYERLAEARPEVVTVHLGGLKYIGRSVIGNALDSGALGLSLKRGSYDHPRFTGANTTERVPQGLEFINNSTSFFYFIHYKTADVVAHNASDRSDSYREAIIANDTQLGRLLDLFDDFGVLDGTKVFVTTDHGFDGNSHVNLQNITVAQTWLASRDFDLMDGPATLLDVTPTVLDAFGIDAAQFTPAYRGHSRLRH